MSYKDKETRREYERARYATKTRRDYLRALQLKHNYGITPAAWDALFAGQGGVCAICRTGAAQKWCTDHDHVTGRVRGILCGACNTGIGQLKDDPIIVRHALAYLEDAAA